MKASLIAEFVGAYSKTFVSKADGKTIKYGRVTLFNTDSFSDVDRYITVPITMEAFEKYGFSDKKVSEGLMGETIQFVVDAQALDNKGSFKLRIIDVIPNKKS